MKKSGFQPGAVRSCVEPRLVAEQPAVDARDPELRQLGREPVEPCARGQRRVAEALQEDVALPDGSVLVAAAQHLGAEAVGGAELLQRRERDRQLLVRGGREREVGVPLEEQLAPF